MLPSGCSKEVENRQNLVVAVQDGITTLDPAFLRLLNEQYVACNLWEGLVRKNVNDSLEPGIAENWEISRDGLEYIFYLRKNALWSDGQPVTAHHFEYAWKRALDPNKDSAVVFMMYFLKNGEAYNKNKAKADAVGVKALDDYTLKVTLENPAPYFLEILNYHTYYPVRPDIIEKDPYSWHKKPYMLISNGPFYLDSWNHNKEIKALKNSYYWDKNNVKLNSITFLIEKRDDKEIWTRYLEGSVDFGYVFPPEVDIANEIATGKNNVLYDDSLGTVYFCFNTQKKPFDDIRVRQAFELALDKNKIVVGEKMNEEVATGFVPPGIPDAEPGVDFRSKGGDFMHKEFTNDNLDKARMLLNEAGYSNMKDFPTIVILARRMDIAKYLKNDWENLGVSVEVDVCKDGLFNPKKDVGEFDVIINSWIADFKDPINFLGFLASEGAFKDMFKPDYYSLVEKSNTVADNFLRMDLLHEAEEILMNSYALIPLYYERDAYYAKPCLKNFLKTPLAEIYFRNAFIDN